MPKQMVGFLFQSLLLLTNLTSLFVWSHYNNDNDDGQVFTFTHGGGGLDNHQNNHPSSSDVVVKEVKVTVKIKDSNKNNNNNRMHHNHQEPPLFDHQSFVQALQEMLGEEQHNNKKHKKNKKFAMAPLQLHGTNADRIVDELRYYMQHGRWSQRVILEKFYQAMETTTVSAQQQPLQYWMDDSVDVCLWEGITCGIITAGSGLAKTTSATGLPILYSNVNCWCLEEWEDEEWDWPTQEEVDNLEMFGTGSLAEREEKRLLLARESAEDTTLIDRLLYADDDVEADDDDDEDDDDPEMEDDQDEEEEHVVKDSERLKQHPRLFQKVKAFRTIMKNACSCPPGQVPRTFPPKNAVTKIDLMEYGIQATIPSELGQLLFLHRLNLNSNQLHGTIPTELGMFENLHFMDLGENQLTGQIPKELALLNNTIDELWLEQNSLSGSFPEQLFSLKAEFIGLHENYLSGSLSTNIEKLEKIVSLSLKGNSFTGTIPTEIGNLSTLKSLIVGENDFTGQIPTEIGLCPLLIDLDVGNNQLTGTLPQQILALTRLDTLNVCNNELSGTLPTLYLPDSEVYARLENNKFTSLMDEYTIIAAESGKSHEWDGEPDNKDWTGFTWASFSDIENISLQGNHFLGPIPSHMFSPTSLRNLDLSFNKLTGTIPKEIMFAEKIETILLQANSFTGTIPEFPRPLEKLAVFNLTANNISGKIPEILCTNDSNKPSTSFFGCDSFLCPPGSFHPEGAASELLGCTPCPSCMDSSVDKEIQPSCSFLGQTICGETQYRGTVGDLNGDGILSVREILFLIYVSTDGKGWGKSFEEWGDINVHECDLVGVGCQKSVVTKLDLRGATLCKEDSSEICNGLPLEIGLISTLQVLDLSNAFFSEFTIPTEIGLLKNLKILDFSRNSLLRGTIPTEIGNCKDLHLLNLSQGQLEGTLPDIIGDLTMLEQINLSQNSLQTTIPSSIGNLSRLNVLILSRLGLHGQIPEEIGNMSALENLELYGNTLSGSIPASISRCVNLKRIDFFNNLLTGSIPSDLSSLEDLQIFHFKANRLEGTIPEFFGTLSHLTWLDVSLNRFSGVIPSSLGFSDSLEVLRLGDNLLKGPIPPGLCKNSKINDGFFQKYSCDFIVCPLGTYSEVGYASVASPCKACPDGFTTISIGSMFCRKLTQRDYLAMFYDVMGGEEWSLEYQTTWNDPDKSECDWAGVTCDSNGDVISLMFPMSEAFQTNIDDI